MGRALTPDEVAAGLRQLHGWSSLNDALTKRYVFASFAEAIHFMQQAAGDIDSLGHHPDWTNSYNRVDVVATTHDARNRVTQNDFALARILDRYAEQVGCTD